jgi:hypothetical protein
LGLFGEGPRIDIRPRQHKESAYFYLARSASPEAEQTRIRIEEWFARYPAEHGGDLALRLRSRNDDQHRSALFELFLHDWLLSHGRLVTAIEPKLPHTHKSPDFLVDGRFYLECVLAAGADLHAVLKRKANRYGALDLPFVIAVQGEGTEELDVVLHTLWHGPRGPQRRGVSAVLQVEAADPWMIGESKLRLVSNPWADRPLPQALF